MLTKFIKKIANMFTKQDKWFLFKGSNGCPDVRYRYQGTRFEVKPKDALNRAIWIMNNEISEIKKDVSFRNKLKECKNKTEN